MKLYLTIAYIILILVTQLAIIYGIIHFALKYW